MTTTPFCLIGHNLRLTVDDGALKECKWTDGAIVPDGSPGNTVQDSELLERAMRQLNEYAEGKRRNFDLPIRPEGTVFRMKVWKELQRIPYGETISYGELARRVGNPKGCRAVANACGANPMPIIIPCHRVVAAGGGTGGYTGGLDIKLTLLEIEKQNRL